MGYPAATLSTLLTQGNAGHSPIDLANLKLRRRTRKISQRDNRKNRYFALGTTLDPTSRKGCLRSTGYVFPDTPDVVTKLAGQEWTIFNQTQEVLPFHLHTNAFQVISADGLPVTPILMA